MVRQVEWSDDALRDLLEIKVYIERDAPATVRSVVAEIETAAEALADFPFAHCLVPEWLDPDRRETFVHRWRLMYLVTPDRVRVVEVIHGSRLLSKIVGRSFREAGQAEYVVV